MPRGTKTQEPRYNLLGMTITELQLLHKLIFAEPFISGLDGVRGAVAELLETDGEPKRGDKGVKQ